MEISNKLICTFSPLLKYAKIFNNTKESNVIDKVSTRKIIKEVVGYFKRKDDQCKHVWKRAGVIVISKTRVISS